MGSFSCFGRSNALLAFPQKHFVFADWTFYVIVPLKISVFIVNAEAVFGTLESIIIAAAKGAELDPSIKRDVKPDF